MSQIPFPLKDCNPLRVNDSPLIGLPVIMEGCPCQCGATTATLGSSKGPHSASVHCDGCGVHRAWISHATGSFILDIINKFGRPVEPIIIRRSS
jgi:hypothetical protein